MICERLPPWWNTRRADDLASARETFPGRGEKFAPPTSKENVLSITESDEGLAEMGRDDTIPWAWPDDTPWPPGTT